MTNPSPWRGPPWGDGSCHSYSREARGLVSSHFTACAPVPLPVTWTYCTGLHEMVTQSWARHLGATDHLPGVGQVLCWQRAQTLSPHV